jgi:gliding motility-associated-like protein
MKVLNIKYIVLFAVYQLIVCYGLSGQNNLLRNSSFEQRIPGTGAKYPINQVQLDDHCRYWESFRTTTSDWFDNSPNHLHGSAGCGNSSVFWNAHPAIPNLDGTHYAGVYAWPDRRGEGLQQRMQHKLRNKTYILSFSYYIPCDTNPYIFDLFFGTSKNDTSLHIKFDTLNREDAGQWHTYQYTFNILPTQDNIYDWFVWVFDGDPGDPTPGNADGSYMFIDDMQLTEHPLTCTSCNPNGLISWNHESIRPYLTPNNDGIFDEWCIRNINNVSWYEFYVFDRWGATVYNETQTNPNGFEDYSICWDGRNNNGQMLNVENFYQIVARLGNCGSQITSWYQAWTSNDLAHDTFSVAQNYVPPLFGLQPSPTHYRNLHLYGGIYWGTHDWYACDSIFVGGYGEPRVSYFIAGYTANLGFYATDGTFIDSGSTDFQLGSDIDIVPQPVQCCPMLRLANPNLPDTEVDSIGELSMSDDPIDAEEDGTMELIDADDEANEFTLNVYPNPVTDVLNIDFHLPTQDFIKATLISASGIAISEVLNLAELEVGDHSYSVSVKSIPHGMYFLQLTRKSGMVTIKVVVQR